MKKSSRILMAFVFVELLLGGIGGWLMYMAHNGMALNVSKAEFGARVGETIGAAMGGIGAVMLVLWFVQRRRERQDGNS